MDNAKWYKARKGKPGAAAAISAVNVEPDFDKREEIYSNHRDELVAEFK